MKQTVKGLLARPESLEMAPVKFEVRRHSRRDSGCRTGAVEHLHEVAPALSRDGRVFAEIPKNIAGRLNILSHIGVHGGALTPRQCALM